jgi:hypothetical protein
MLLKIWGKTIRRFAYLDLRGFGMCMHSEVFYSKQADKSIRPEFIRLPRPKAQCPHTGLSRSYMNQLILPSEANGYDPPVKSHSLKKRGNIRGIRLISYDSLIGYLNSLGEENETEGHEAETPKQFLDCDPTSPNPKSDARSPLTI